MPFSRRAFIASAATSMAFAGFGVRAQDEAAELPSYLNEVEGYGPLLPDPKGMLDLPRGFSYRIISQAGETMADGLLVPGAFDGMGCFPLGGDHVALVRNHELGPAAFNDGAFGLGGRLASLLPKGGAYDHSDTGLPLPGGTTTLVYDLKTGQTIRQHLSLAGTAVNCAGGTTPWGSWITCEETTLTAGLEVGKDHGYAFEVPSAGKGLTDPVPLQAMGRFRREAVCIDPRTGVVYQTEDAGSGVGSGFYRFLPVDPYHLSRGGRLQMLAIRRRPQADLREGQRPDARLPVEWVTITNPDPAGPFDVFNEGFAKGGAKFNRLEGCWQGGGSIFFASTSGGDVKNGDVNADGFEEGYGQIWEYRPAGKSGGHLSLLFESPDGDVLDSPDNIVVTPRGGILICEDDASSANVGQNDTSRFFGEDKNRLVGLTMRGTSFIFAENILSESELAGACWSKDGEFLFVNIYGEDVAGSGGTIAITGPWERGAL
jgi:secreted PhoX family phosphatase